MHLVDKNKIFLQTKDMNEVGVHDNMAHENEKQL